MDQLEPEAIIIQCVITSCVQLVACEERSNTNGIYNA